MLIKYILGLIYMSNSKIVRVEPTGVENEFKITTVDASVRLEDLTTPEESVSQESNVPLFNEPINTPTTSIFDESNDTPTTASSLFGDESISNNKPSTTVSTNKKLLDHYIDTDSNIKQELKSTPAMEELNNKTIIPIIKNDLSKDNFKYWKDNWRFNNYDDILKKPIYKNLLTNEKSYLTGGKKIKTRKKVNKRFKTKKRKAQRTSQKKHNHRKFKGRKARKSKKKV